MGDQLTNQLNSYDFLFSSKSQTPPAANSKDYIGNFNHSPDCPDNACDDAISWSVCPAFVWFIFLASMFVSYCLVISLVTFSSVRCTLDRYKRHQEFYLFIYFIYLEFTSPILVYPHFQNVPSGFMAAAWFPGVGI